MGQVSLDALGIVGIVDVRVVQQSQRVSQYRSSAVNVTRNILKLFTSKKC
jgi:hypothetical protein